MKQFVSYLRVSTQKQGTSGLGLEAQKQMCQNFVSANGGEIVKEFQDIESGTHRDRKGLWQAIDYCQKSGTPLVIAKLDRLARDVEFTFKVINTGIDIHFTDMPVVNSMVLGVFSAVAQYEREMCSTRTKQALAAKKARGEKLGAASDNYRISKQSLHVRGHNAGQTRRKRCLDNRDTIALIRIMKSVFPRCAETPEEHWLSSFVNTRHDDRIKVLTMMRDYAQIDESGKLFAKWDFSDMDSRKLQFKLASKMQNIIRMVRND